MEVSEGRDANGWARPTGREPVAHPRAREGLRSVTVLAASFVLAGTALVFAAHEHHGDRALAAPLRRDHTQAGGDARPRQRRRCR